MEYYKPNFCYEATYCLKGAFTPFIDGGNAQAAQACIAGTFCGAGSASPDGKGKCQEGYYCPEGSNEMTPADIGHSALGTGNTQQTPCSPGSFQRLTAQATCTPCPRGYYCDASRMVEPKICGIGTYAKELSST